MDSFAGVGSVYWTASLTMAAQIIEAIASVVELKIEEWIATLSPSGRTSVRRKRDDQWPNSSGRVYLFAGELACETARRRGIC